MLRKNPDERPSAETLLRKRFFTAPQLSQKLRLTMPKRVSSAPVKRSVHSSDSSTSSYKSHIKGLGPLSVYATPLLRRPVKSKSHQGVAQKKKGNIRKTWKSPTQTLLVALKSMSLFEGETTAVKDTTFTIDHRPMPENLNFGIKSKDSDLCEECQFSDDSLNLDGDDKTWVLESDSAYLRLERWLASLEDIHGIDLLKNSIRLKLSLRMKLN